MGSRLALLSRGRPSVTAMMVAYWRVLATGGVTSVPGFSDPFARVLLEGTFWRWMLRRADRTIADPRLREAMRPWVDAIAMRVAFLDAGIADAACPQVVILGAGLDTRAWRLEALRDAHVLEVDHPSTQGYKRDHAKALGAPLGRHTYVPVDFGNDDLGACLTAAGHDPKRPTTWLWEGVIMYLDDDAVRATLAAVHAASAPGSVLLAHYHEPADAVSMSVGRRVFFGFLGEPQIGQRPRDEMRALVVAGGFDVLEDAGMDEQARRVSGTPATSAIARASRILVARPV